MNISKPVIALLQTLEFKGNVALELPKVDRKVYDEFNEVLTRLRGKWKRAKRGHEFPYDPRQAIAAVIDSGVMPADNPLAYYPTPDAIADKLVAHALELTGGSPRKVLEPSAGSGSLIRAVCRAMLPESITALELDPLNVATLLCLESFRPEYAVEAEKLGISTRPAPEISVEQGDFLTYDFCGETFDLVIKNPPFTAPGDPKVWVAHIMRAFELLTERGVVASIVPDGAWRTSDQKAWVEFRRFLFEQGARWEFHEPGSFASGGTMIGTVSLVIPREPIDAETSAWQIQLYAENTYAENRRILRLKSDHGIQGGRARGLTPCPLPSSEPKVQKLLREIAVRCATDPLRNKWRGSGGISINDAVMRELSQWWDEIEAQHWDDTEVA